VTGYGAASFSTSRRRTTPRRTSADYRLEPLASRADPSVPTSRNASSTTGRTQEHLPQVTIFELHVLGCSIFSSSKLAGSQCFQLGSHTRGHGHSTDPPEGGGGRGSRSIESPSRRYPDFADMFSKDKSQQTTEPRPTMIKLTLDERTNPPLRPYLLLRSGGTEALHKFIDENLDTGFIVRPFPGGSTGLLFFSSERTTAHFGSVSQFPRLNRISEGRYPAHQ